jgi:hypothetical protein
MDLCGNMLTMGYKWYWEAIGGSSDFEAPGYFVGRRSYKLLEVSSPVVMWHANIT